MNNTEYGKFLLDLEKCINDLREEKKTLQAENERLKEALRELSKMCQHSPHIQTIIQSALNEGK